MAFIHDKTAATNDRMAGNYAVQAYAVILSLSHEKISRQ